MRIEYPLYLVPLEAGYVSVVEHTPDDEPTYYLAVFTDEFLAVEFMRECGIDAEARPLHNSREFAWLAQSLRAPITNLAFDPLADSTSVEARWKVPVKDVLEKHIRVDYSPWNYPVFVVDQEDGFASVEGTTSQGDELRAIGLFTTKEKAEEYLSEADEQGFIRQLDDLPQVRSFLEDVSGDVSAVALNLSVQEGQRTAKYCFSIKTVLEKYLVEPDKKG